MMVRNLLKSCGLAWVAAGLLAGSAGQSVAADEALIEAAKEEGEVVWYSTLIVDQLVRPLAAAFEEKYPGITVSYSRAPAGEVALKLRNEIRANSVQADVFDANSAFFQAMPLDNLVEYKAEAWSEYPDSLKDPQGRYTAVNVFTMATGINTDLVPEGERPETYQDLLDPKWKGKMAWTTDLTPNGPPGFIGNILMTMGEEEGMEYLRQLSEQDIINVPASQRVVLDQVIAGEYPIGLMIFNHHVVISSEQGAPVAWLRIEPLISTANYAGLLKNSPHPNAGKLFLDFMLSKEGQKVFQEANYLPAHPDVPAAEPSLKPKEGGFEATTITNAQALEMLPKWVEVYKELFE